MKGKIVFKIGHITKIFCVFLVIFTWYSVNISGIAIGTKISTPEGLILIENLVIGDTIYGGNCREDISLVKIRNILTYILHDYLAIKTGTISICASHDQLFYDDRQAKFIFAEDIDDNVVLLSQNGDGLNCKTITIENSPILFYELVLDEPHIFFSSEACVLTHNFVQAAALVPITEWVLEGLTVIACAYLNQPYKQFVNFEQGKQHVLNDQIEYATHYDKLLNSGIVYRNTALNHSAKMMGIMLDPMKYQEVMRCPSLYGPICAQAHMQDDGDIEIILNIYGFDYQNEESQVFSWKELGREIVRRDHEIVKIFIDAEDKKQLSALNHIVKNWPRGVVGHLFTGEANSKTENIEILKSRYGVSEKGIYGRSFELYALYNMASYDISPSLVLHTIKYGSSELINCDFDQYMIFSDFRKDIAVLLDIESDYVIDVGYYGDSFEHLTAKEEALEDNCGDESEELEEEESREEQEESGVKTVEDILEECEPGKETKDTQQHFHPGSFEDANDDFDALRPTNVQDRGNGLRTGILSDGRKINVRPTSSNNSRKEGGFPTLEIQGIHEDEQAIKIRYTKK